MTWRLATDEEQKQLISLAREGDPQERRRALACLLLDFRGPALAVIHRTLASAGLGREHAEEIFQAAVLKFLNVGLSSYRGAAAPRTLFVRIALNCALDLLRLRSRERALPDSGASEEAPSPDAAAQLDARQLREALESCLAELSEALRTAIMAYYLEERGDCATCAAHLGVARNTLEQRLSRGRLALADCVRRKTDG